VRLKFTTLPNNTPVGIDTFYEALKGVVHRRINRVVQVWRGRESKKLAESSLEELRQQALILVGTNALLSEEQRNTDKLWINQIATDKTHRSGSQVGSRHLRHRRPEVAPRNLNPTDRA
jgi:RecG-like helicase